MTKEITNSKKYDKYPNYEELRLKAWAAIYEKRAEKTEVLKEHEVMDFKSTSQFLTFLNKQDNENN